MVHAAGGAGRCWRLGTGWMSAALGGRRNLNLRLMAATPELSE